jgi:hypothetical protein
VLRSLPPLKKVVKAVTAATESVPPSQTGFVTQ